MKKADIALIGLAVMGQNLALNMRNHGYSVAVYNRSWDKTQAFIADQRDTSGLLPCQTLQELTAALATPRMVLLMVKAGAAVDATIEALLPYLQPGDLIIDGGNSFFEDTVRRERSLAQQGIHFMGAGISGGEEGALHGPSIMPGGSAQAWQMVGELLCTIGAQVGGQPCCAHIGADGSGHFVKMVHNGIEYADMQLIGECYYLMRELLAMPAAEIGAVFKRFNSGVLDSYLIQITADILTRTDPLTGNPLVDMILDEAGQKGTGKWTSQQALEMDVGAPTVAEAVFARMLSAQKARRLAASEVFPEQPPRPKLDREAFINDIEKALYASKICAYAQGFDLMRTVGQQRGWQLDLGSIAMLWRGGCIIRARFLEPIKQAYDANPALANLMLADQFAPALRDAQSAWRRVVGASVAAGAPAPCLSSALAYFDTCRAGNLPANLLQAQRDYFGAHTYKRVDRPGDYHTKWVEEE